MLRRIQQQLKLASPSTQRQVNELQSQLASVAVQLHDAQRELVATLATAQQQQRSLLDHIERQQQELVQVREQLADAMKRESHNVVQQVEAFLNLQSLWSGQGTPMPPLHGWPVSSDIALHLAELLRTERYDQVIEFGSGSSTLIIARLQQQLGGGRLLTFEHLSKYHEQTTALLQRGGLKESVDLQLAPLASRGGANGREYRYYDCDTALARTAQALRGVSAPKLLVFVDGPPAATGAMARYPALDAVLVHFPAAALHFLLDDYGRQDEKDIVKTWEADLRRAERAYVHTSLPMEKGASMLRIAPANATVYAKPSGGGQV
ncbi:class I SAM-dependent methyltransferase [Azohydromonas australica]|uniref:class I SAM-dependent methyltransferase n=1 Tax=Azohydromonas australica TaxID=364039 RepID=UPI00146DF6F5|nr:class I SAM-dependent methyltransferase [Azohydromonas australica]